MTRYIPVPKNPHGLNTSPDGKYFIANGKLSPTVSIIAIAMLDDLFAGKLKDPRDVVVGEPELGLGPLHTTFDGRGNAYTTLFIDSQICKWNIEDAIQVLQGAEGELHPSKARCDVSAGSQSRQPRRIAGCRWQMAGRFVQILQRPLSAGRAPASGERSTHRHIRTMR